MKIVADIGGTHARFAVYENGMFSNFKKYRASDFASLEEALSAYGAGKAPLRIATAAYEDGGVWRFVNDNKWLIDPQALNKNGWKLELILNDFAAGAWGLSALPPQGRRVLKKGKAGYGNLPRCLLGPGTGLGLGYLTPLPEGGHHVQYTHGCHMAASAVTEEQEAIIRAVRSFKKTAVVFETLVSGKGLYNIYCALCKIEGRPPALADAEALFGHLDDPQAMKALRLFHEFLGVFSSAVVVCGHAYGGLYLTGGVLDRLVKSQCFDFAQVEKFFMPDVVASVTRDLQATEISLVTDEWLAFRGLLKARP